MKQYSELLWVKPKDTTDLKLQRLDLYFAKIPQRVELTISLW